MASQKLATKMLLALMFAVPAVQAVAEPALKTVFAGDFDIGAALNQTQIFGKTPDETALIVKHFNSITPENILKWQSVHPRPDQYNFEPADQYVEMGQKNEMFIVGHTLIWHNQTPDWVFEDADGKPVDRTTLLKRMKEHIHAVVGRYKGRIHGWDVVNEAIEEDGSLRKTKWLQIIGDDYIAKAFEYAHQADPDAELYYNDYNMCDQKHRDGVIRLVKNLQVKGLRIDAIGMQGHWSLDYPSLREADQSIMAFAELGVQIMITELDLTVLPSAWQHGGADITQNEELKKELNPYSSGLPVEMQEKLALRYADCFSLFRKHADKISRVTFWGVQNGNSWRNNWPVRGRTDYALLFDRNCHPTPAFNAVVETAQNNTPPPNVAD